MDNKDYNGVELRIGNRVELHPGCDLWMRGAKFGDIVGEHRTLRGHWRVKLDLYKKIQTVPSDLLQRI